MGELDAFTMSTQTGRGSKGRKAFVLYLFCAVQNGDKRISWILRNQGPADWRATVANGIAFSNRSTFGSQDYDTDQWRLDAREPNRELEYWGDGGKGVRLYASMVTQLYDEVLWMRCYGEEQTAFVTRYFTRTVYSTSWRTLRCWGSI